MYLHNRKKNLLLITEKFNCCTYCDSFGAQNTLLHENDGCRTIRLWSVFTVVMRFSRNSDRRQRELVKYRRNRWSRLFMLSGKVSPGREIYVIASHRQPVPQAMEKNSSENRHANGVAFSRSVSLVFDAAGLIVLPPADHDWQCCAEHACRPTPLLMEAARGCKPARTPKSERGGGRMREGEIGTGGQAGGSAGNGGSSRVLQRCHPSHYFGINGGWFSFPLSRIHRFIECSRETMRERERERRSLGKLFSGTRMSCKVKSADLRTWLYIGYQYFVLHSAPYMRLFLFFKQGLQVPYITGSFL